jgi:hypothetical protein
LTEEIISACDQNIPKRKQNNTTRGNQWWTERHKVNNLRRRYQRNQTTHREEVKRHYLTARDRYKQQLVDSKLESWKKFITESTSDNPWGLLYKIAKNQLNKEKISELKIGDQIIINNKQIANTLFNTFFPKDESIPDQDCHRSMRNKLLQLNTSNSDNDLKFTEREVTDIINKQNYRKSPGYDGLTADIIQCIHNTDRELLTLLYNKCLQLSAFPSIWKQSIVKVIPKSSRTDYRDPNSYRPISLYRFWERHSKNYSLIE